MNLALIGFISFLITSSNVRLAKAQNIVHKTDNSIVLDVPFVHQIDDLPQNMRGIVGSTACGPAAVTMLLNYVGIDINLADVIERLPAEVYIKGDRFYNLYNSAKYFGKTTIKLNKTVQDIYSALNSNNPVILNIQNYDGITGHAVVVVGITGYDGKSAETLIVHDPFVGPYQRFDYATENTLKQPSGYINVIGTLDPFYID